MSRRSRTNGCRRQSAAAPISTRPSEVLHEHGGLWFWDESVRDLAQAGFRVMDASTLTTAQRDRMAALIGNCSIELSPRDEFAGDALRKLFDPGTTVFRQSPAQRDASRHRRRLRSTAARRLQSGAPRRGAPSGELHPGQRLSATGSGRGRGRTHPAHRRRREPGRAVPRRTRSAGDRRHRAARHRSCLVCRLSRKDIRQSMRSALDARIAGQGGARWQRSGLDVSLVTQFGFEAEPILRWIAAQRAQGIDVPRACRNCRTGSCRDLGEVRRPLRHRCVAARVGPRPYGFRAHHGGSRTRSADQRNRYRRRRECCNRGPAPIYLRGCAPHSELDHGANKTANWLKQLRP